MQVAPKAVSLLAAPGFYPFRLAYGPRSLVRVSRRVRVPGITRPARGCPPTNLKPGGYSSGAEPPCCGLPQSSLTPLGSTLRGLCVALSPERPTRVQLGWMAAGLGFPPGSAQPPASPPKALSRSGRYPGTSIRRIGFHALFAPLSECFAPFPCGTCMLSVTCSEI